MKPLDNFTGRQASHFSHRAYHIQIENVQIGNIQIQIGNAQIGNVQIRNAQIGNIKLGNAEIGRMEFFLQDTINCRGKVHARRQAHSNEALQMESATWSSSP